MRYYPHPWSIKNVALRIPPTADSNADILCDDPHRNEARKVELGYDDDYLNHAAVCCGVRE